MRYTPLAACQPTLGATAWGRFLAHARLALLFKGNVVKLPFNPPSVRHYSWKQGLAGLLCGFLITPLANAQDAAQAKQWLSPELRQVSEQLIAKAQQDDTAYRLVESLTTEVGARLAGSPAEARARQWALAQMQRLGLSNARIEPFPVWHWERGGESAEILEPFPQHLHVTAMGHSVATGPEGISAEVVRFATLPDLQEASAEQVRGKIVFVDEHTTRAQDGSGYGMSVQQRSGAAAEAGRLGAVAALIRSVGTDKHRFPHTGVMRYPEGVTQVPAAALSAPDADQLSRALARGPVRLRLVLNNQGGGRTTDAWSGDAGQLTESGNVIGEVPGTTDEVVVLGAHLDSWDLGTGAIDDGAGVGIVMAAAHLLQQLPQRPKRTIRVVLFGSEEVGIAGSKAYADAYQSSLDKHVLAAESDFGARTIWRLQTAFGEDKLDKAQAFFRVLRPLGVTPGDNLAHGGPDLTFLRLGGVPVVSLSQNGWDYFDYHHTADDTFDKIDAAEMAQNVAVYAAFAWLAANMEGDFRAATVAE